ncbi:MAG: hypothetical protein EOO77_37170 [Oxalobacteraceae bacterium]|nr:MAG: hypothetical protein EOO77_37170 [Oxalobacteraceae bacterium]
MQDDSSSLPAVAATAPQRLMLVTGMLGAGKTTALRVLEDLGWETVDNFPIRLLDRLIDTPQTASAAGLRGSIAIGFDSRTRILQSCYRPRSLGQIRSLRSPMGTCLCGSQEYMHTGLSYC